MIDLGKASIIAGVASFFIEPVNWLYAFSGITLGIVLIAGGLRIAYYAETLGEENA